MYVSARERLALVLTGAIFSTCAHFTREVAMYTDDIFTIAPHKRPSPAT